MHRWLRCEESGLALITVLVITILATGIGIALVGLMNTDMTHAGVQHAKTRSFYVAQAGLEAAKAAMFATTDPVGFTTPPEGVSAAYGGGGYTFWVDAGPASGCGDGLKTLEATGEVAYLTFTISSRVRACGVPGAPFLTALFGVSLVEARGATSRTYVAPFSVGTPGNPRGGNIGSFTEINFPDNGLRLNAVSEACAASPALCSNPDYVTLRNPSGPGTIEIEDYRLFGFGSDPTYEINPNVDATPWILADFGDIVKAQPAEGPLSNRCGTPYACVTTCSPVKITCSDIQSLADLRLEENGRHLYMASMPYAVIPRMCDPALPQFCLDPEDFRIMAQANTSNGAINEAAGLVGKLDSVYDVPQFESVVSYLAAGNCPPRCLQGTIFVDTFRSSNCAGSPSGCFAFNESVNLGGYTGNVTLAISGDLVIKGNIEIRNQHDLATVEGRRTPGILVFGLTSPRTGESNICKGETSNGSGRLIMCGGDQQMLIADGFMFTRDGMFVGAQGKVDLIGGMYHDNRGTSNPSYENGNSQVVVRFDPLSMSWFDTGVTIVSWQQLK